MINRFSTQGYNIDSPDVGNKSNLINSDDITMEKVKFPVTGIGSDGQVIHMKPGVKHYKFKKGPVLEFPTK